MNQNPLAAFHQRQAPTAIKRAAKSFTEKSRIPTFAHYLTVSIATRATLLNIGQNES